MECVAACHFSPAMTAHPVGNSKNTAAVLVELYVCTVFFFTDEMVSHENHILIIMSHTANSTGRRYF